MPLQIVGAGVGRTGTLSLKKALERLLGEPCYHMEEVFTHPEHNAVWTRACRGEAVDWEAELFAGFAAAVDWPACACWPELMEAYPDAKVLLSVRSSPEAWHRSADRTIFEVMRGGAPPVGAEMVVTMMARFSPEDFLADPALAMAAYERHNAAVRAAVPPERLVEWQPGDDWGPLCAALDLPLPDEPFPHVNSTEDFRSQLQLD